LSPRRRVAVSPRLSSASGAACCFKRIDDADCRVSVPEFRHAPAWRRMIERGEGFAADDFRVVADEAIGAFADGHRALGVAAQGQARNAERRRLFLYAAAVGEHQSAVAVELQKI